MRLLLDTHILIWFLEGNSSLSNPRQQVIVDSRNEVFVSIASLWEMAIKVSLGKLNLSKPLADVVKQLATDNIAILLITPSHTVEVSTLPFHHRDPFDRIIIAQSKIENLPVMTDDAEFSAYGIKLL